MSVSGKPSIQGFMKRKIERNRFKKEKQKKTQNLVSREGKMGLQEVRGWIDRIKTHCTTFSKD